MAVATSQNRWPIYTSGSHRDLVALPLVTGRVRSGAPAVILGYVAEQFHKRVEKVRRDWSWGYAYRAVRGQTSGYSNHASATAIDLNAPNHPLGAKGTFSAAQVREIRKILGECEGLVRWGGDYVRRPDEMHFEINVPPSDSRLARVAAKLSVSPGLPSSGVNNTPSKPTTATTQGGLSMSDINALMAKIDYVSEQVKAVQQSAHDDRTYMKAQLRAVADLVGGRAALDQRKADTRAAVEAAVKSLGLGGSVDAAKLTDEIARDLAKRLEA